MDKIETDYLVIGSGAVGMAFVDTLLDESEADIVIVDRHHAPGGHWNDAYPFVRLHQPSSFYGVASTELGGRRIDQVGWNKGLFELASGAEVLAYFDRVMRERFLPSGRVRYLPMSELTPVGAVKSLISGETQPVRVRRKTVDSTYFNTTVPSRHTRKFEVADGVTCIAPNALPLEAPHHRRFTIVGAGKTAMDVGVWLIEAGADPSAIRWIRPRESWLINRDTTQPDPIFFEQTIGGFLKQLEAIAAANSLDDLFDRLEADGLMLRIDPDRRPTMLHYATISRGEIDRLRRIEDIIAGARVERIEAHTLIMADGRTVPADPETLYIDCSATAVERRPLLPVFDGDRITLQMVRIPNPTFSAALAAHLEVVCGDDETKKNALCKPVPLADTPEEWLSSTLGNMTNQLAWSQEPGLSDWMVNCRLDGFAAVIRDVDKTRPEVAGILARLKTAGMPAAMNLQKLIGALGAA